jgi:hypothetical protein
MPILRRREIKPAFQNGAYLDLSEIPYLVPLVLEG